jgi:zinc protease
MAVDRTRLPAVGADPLFALPTVEHHRLANGLAVRTVEHHSVPVVTAVLMVEGGSGADPASREGLAALTADMVDEGTGALSAIEVSDRMARIGAQYDVDVGPDATVFTLTTLARFAERGVQLLGDLVMRPSLRETDFTRVRQLRLDRLRQLKDIPPTVAERAFLRTVYGSHPYAHLALGTEDALSRLTLEDISAFHAEMCRPSASTLVLVGDLTHQDLAAIATAVFGGWPGRDEEARGSLPAARIPIDDGAAAGVVIVPREGAAQSELRIGHLVTGRSTPDYAALLVMNAVLGGQFVSRVNLKLREEKGYTYGARTGFDWRRGPTPFVLSAAVHTAATVDAIRDSLAELEGIRGSRPPTDAEIDLAKASLTRGFPRNFETAQQVARAIAQLILYGLPDSYFATFVPKVNSVTGVELVAAAARHLDPSKLTTLVVGDHSVIGSQLQTLTSQDLRVLPSM